MSFTYYVGGAHASHPRHNLKCDIIAHEARLDDKDVPMFYADRSKGLKPYWTSVVGLVTHLIATAIIFTALFSIGWLVSIALHALHRIHPFPEEIFRLISRMEIYLVYADAALSTVVLFIGMWRFCKDVVEAR